MTGDARVAMRGLAKGGSGGGRRFAALVSLYIVFSHIEPLYLHHNAARGSVAVLRDHVGQG